MSMATSWTSVIAAIVFSAFLIVFLKYRDHVYLPQSERVSVATGEAKPYVPNLSHCVNSGARHFLNISSLTSSEITTILGLAKDLKAQTYAGKTPHHFEEKHMALVFTKPSLRTRASFESGFHRMGGHTVYFAPNDVGLGKREEVRDIARVLSRMFDVIVARTHLHAHLLELACHSKVPVVNALSNYNHPVQVMSDLLTISEALKLKTELGLKGKKVVYVGDCNNMVTSWLQLATVIPFHFVAACPASLAPPDADAFARAVGAKVSKVEHSTDVHTAVVGADVIYADVWTSMGFKEQEAERLSHFKGWTINDELLSRTGKSSTIFLHCLPAERGREVSDSVIEGKHSVVWAQAENRMHMQNAILTFLFSAHSSSKPPAPQQTS